MLAVFRQPVESSNVCAVGYDAELRTLEIEFGKDCSPGDPRNRLYHFFDVPPEVHQELMSFWSPGRFVNRQLNFPYRYLGTVEEVDR